MIDLLRTWFGRGGTPPAAMSSDSRLLIKLPEDDFGRYPKPPTGFPLIHPQVLIDQHQDLLGKIRRATGTSPPEAWEGLFMDAVHRYARFVHLLPASQGDHHRGPGGLLRHGLEVAHRTMLHGYGHVPDMTNYPTENRRFESRWPYACFIAGLCHDLGKAVTDLLVTDESGEHIWSPYTEGIIDWCLRLNIERYYINYRPNRHKLHSAFNLKVTHLVLKPEGDRFIAEASNKLIADVTDAIMGVSTSLSPLVRYVMKADAESCEHDRKSNPPSDGTATHTSSLPAHKYILDAVRRCVSEGDWKPNHSSSPLFIINRAMYLIWPRAAADIVNRMHSKSGVPLNPEVMAELLHERGLITEFSPDPQTNSLFWSILPEPLETVGAKTPLKAICFSKAAAFFEVEIDSVAAKIFNPIAVVKAARAGGTSTVEPISIFRAIKASGITDAASEGEVSPSSANPAGPPAHATPQAPPEAHSSSDAAGNSTRKPAPNANTATVVRPPAPPESADLPPPSFELIPPDYEQYLRAAPSEEDLSALLGEPPSHPVAGHSSTSDQPKKKAPLEKSQPKLVEKRGRGGVNASIWFKRSEHAIGATLVAFAERLVESPDRPERALIGQQGGLVVLQYPEAVADLGLVPLTLVNSLRTAGWLSDELSIAPIQQGVLFPRSIVLERTISERLLELLDGVPVPNQPNLAAAKEAAKRMRAIAQIKDDEPAEPEEIAPKERPRLLATVITEPERQPLKQVTSITQSDPVPDPVMILPDESAATASSSAPAAPRSTQISRAGIIQALRSAYQETPEHFQLSTRKTTFSAPEAFVVATICARVQGASPDAVKRAIYNLKDITSHTIDGVPSYRFNHNLIVAP